MKIVISLAMTQNVFSFPIRKIVQFFLKELYVTYGIKRTWITRDDATIFVNNSLKSQFFYRRVDV